MFWALMVLFVAVGASFAVVKVSVFGMLGLVTVQSDSQTSQSGHSSHMSFLESFFMLGSVAGYWLMSLFTDSSSMSWFTTFLVIAGLIAAAAAIVTFTSFNEDRLAGSQPEAGGSTGLRDIVLQMIRLVAQPAVLTYCACTFCYLVLEQGLMSWLPSNNAKVLHLSPDLGIQISSILAGAISLGRFAAGFAVKFVRWHIVLTVALLLFMVVVVISIQLGRGANAGVVFHLRDAPAVAFVFPLVGVFLGPVYPALNSIVLSLFPPPQHGMIAGLMSFFSALGGAFGSLLVGGLFQLVGGENAFYVLLGPALLLIGATLFLNYQAGKWSRDDGGSIELRNVGDSDDQQVDDELTGCEEVQAEEVVAKASEPLT